ncbi:MAG: hypothetical protein QXK37_00600 [Candidatus Woesearchaeota archaeon]
MRRNLKHNTKSRTKTNISLPKIKKNVEAFLLEEDGKISKQAVVTIGSVLSGAALVSLSAKDTRAGCCPAKGTDTSHSQCWDHSNSLSGSGAPIAGHKHHYNHGSHASHSSHSSHASGGGGT